MLQQTTALHSWPNNIMMGSVLFYDFLLASSTGCLYLSSKEDSRSKELMLITAAFFLTFIPAALRYGVGLDYFSYIGIYENISSGLESRVEPGFYYLNHFLSSLGLGYEWLFVSVAFIIYFFFFLSYPKKYRALFHYFFFTLIYTHTLNIMREMIALGIFSFAIMSFWEKRHMSRYVVAITVAVLFHKVAFLYYALIIFYKDKFAKYVKILAIPSVFAFIAIFFARSDLMHFIYTSGVVGAFGFEHYLGGKYDIEDELGSGIGYMIQIMPLIVAIFFQKRILRYDNRCSILLVIICIALFLSAISLASHVFNRVHEAFFLAYMLAPFLILKTPTIPYRKFIVSAFILGYALNFNYKLISKSLDPNATAGPVPYNTIFNKTDNPRPSF